MTFVFLWNYVYRRAVPKILGGENKELVPAVERDVHSGEDGCCKITHGVGSRVYSSERVRPAFLPHHQVAGYQSAPPTIR